MKKVIGCLVTLLSMSAIMSCNKDDSHPDNRDFIMGVWAFDEYEFYFDGEKITVPHLDTTIVEPSDTTIVEYSVITWLAEDSVWYSLNVGSVYFDSDGYCYNYDVGQWSYNCDTHSLVVNRLNEDEDVPLTMYVSDDGLLCTDDCSLRILGYYIHNDTNTGLHRPSWDSLYGYDGNSHTLVYNIKLRKVTNK